MTENRSTPVIIRQRLAEDLAEAGKALVRTHQVDGYPVEGVADPVAWLTSPHLLRAWVAEVSGRVVGHVAVSQPSGESAVTLWSRISGDSPDRIAVLERLFVAPEARGLAGGEYLMAAPLMYAREHELRLVLDVMTKDTAAIRLYERLGWQRIGTAVHRYGDGEQADAICYVSPPERP